MKKYLRYFFIASILYPITAAVPSDTGQDGKVRIVNLYDGASSTLKEIQEVFEVNNAGYSLAYVSGIQRIDPQDYTQVAFVQEIQGVTNQEVIGNVTVTDRSGLEKQSEAIVGDIVILLQGETLIADAEMGFLIFHVPENPEYELPTFIRPDWDPNISDTPGGCATEIDAYRRILLTWEREVGDYIFHAINAHRVRITDSFSHYHPVEGGFDEFYLVQMAEPGAKILISEKTDMIKNPDAIKRSDINGLLQEYPLEVGDLVYIPRGVVHRGFGNVVVQVITVPGFIPGSEIGVDHHLRRINERLGLFGDEALPYNIEASVTEVIR